VRVGQAYMNYGRLEDTGATHPAPSLISLQEYLHWYLRGRVSTAFKGQCYRFTAVVLITLASIIRHPEFD